MASQTHDTPEQERVASVRLTVTQHDRLRELAELEDRTLGQELRRLVKRRLDDAEAAA